MQESHSGQILWSRENASRDIRWQVDLDLLCVNTHPYPFYVAVDRRPRIDRDKGTLCPFGYSVGSSGLDFSVLPMWNGSLSLRLIG